MYDILKQNFLRPGPEFSPLPFWFLNDEPDEKTLISQINEMHSKGIDGFIIHPRMGLPESIKYLSEEYFEYIEICVRHAAKLKMSVVLYDEAGYPSGSAHGLVAAANPCHAARALYRVKNDESGEFNNLPLYEEVVARIDGYTYILGFTNGTIRGIHEGEDDGQPNAPKASDLLNPNAVDSFISITYDGYYERLKKYFGKTIIGIFTDEPSLTGRNADMKDKIPWTYEFIYDFIDAGGNIEELPKLFVGHSPEYKNALRKRLAQSYYGRLSAWCKAHAVALMGHPDSSGETDFLQYFDIPGQDLVWRWVEPDNNLTSRHGVVGKCSADTARHTEKQRNSNEVLGVCGKSGNPWDLTASDMMWYFNHLFARGVNLIIPHAFYYSLRTPTQFNERPPDVGMNNIWWKYYGKFVNYIKRMCWLNTNSVNKPYAAVLCESDNMPYLSVKSLYENGIDFNYLNADIMAAADINDGRVCVNRYRYDIILIDESVSLSESAEEFIEIFESTGGKVCREGSGFLNFVSENADITERFYPTHNDLRIVRLRKCGINYILLVNEGDVIIKGKLQTELRGKFESFNAFTGKIEEIYTDESGMLDVKIMPRIAMIIAVDENAEPSGDFVSYEKLIGSHDISEPIKISKSDNRRYILRFDEIHDLCEIFINDKYAGEMLFIPWELDVTRFIEDGVNNIKYKLTESIANKYGKPVPSGAVGGVLDVYEYGKS